MGSERRTVHTRYAEAEPYVTRDGSTIRELMHPARHGSRNQSLAEATVPPGGRTFRHLHRRSEELYHVTAGEGLMHLGGEAFPVAPGDTVLIRPGTPHWIENTGEEPLRILCCCSPAYAHEDTELLGEAG
jgi:mannose-6-phosphate isomerase-like protein (cupin superfamily)